MRFVIAIFFTFIFSSICYADSGVGAGGILSTGIAKPGGGTLTGLGIGIGQVEGTRPGKPTADGGPDDAMNSATTIVPAQVYMRTATANTNGFRVVETFSNTAHAQWVASVMISTDNNAPGVAPGAELHAGGFATTSVTQRDAAITANHIARRNSGNIHAINMSFGMALDGGESLNADAHLTQFVDWSAKEHDTLYVIAGREDGGGAGPVPSTNYNGITVASSARDIGGGSWSSTWSGNEYFDDAAGARVSVDLIAPGVLMDAVDVGGALVNPDVTGTSFAAPHVTAAVALLQEYAVARRAISTVGWGATNPRRHEVMKALLLNSAEKLSGVHGSSRTHFNRNNQRWDQTTAHNSDTTPLDLHFGAGHLNVSAAVTNFASGEQNPNPGPVSLTGWDYGSVGSSFVDYDLDGIIGGGTWVAVTLAWDREVEMTGFGSNYTSTSDFFDRPINMELENLDLYFMPASSENIADAIFESTASGDSVEHIFKQLDAGQGGQYKIRVVNSGGPEGFADFGLAWRTTAAPTNGDNDGDGDVDGDDLNSWAAAYGTTSGGDADADGDSDGADFLAWQRNFTGPGPVAASAAAVPEPSTLMLLALGLPVILGRRTH